MKKTNHTENAASSGRMQNTEQNEYKKIQNEENLFRTLIEQSPEIIFLVNRDSVITYANAKSENALGLNNKDIVGCNMFKFIHPDDLNLAVSAFDQFLNKINSDIHRTEIRIAHHDKTWHTMEAIGTRLINHGVVDAVLMNLRDVTNRKKTEEDLKKSEAMYRLLADNITEYIWIMDFNLSLIYVSPSVEKIYGYALDEIKNFKLRQLFTEESYKELIDAFSTELPNALAKPPSPEGTRFILQLQARHKDGHLFWIENRISFIRDENGKPSSLMGETIDITDQKKAQDKLRDEEQRFRAVADQSSDIIIMVDRQGNVTYENPAVSILGFNATERLGSNAFELAHPDNLKSVIQTFNLLFSDKNATIQKGEIQLRHRDGSWRTFEAMASNLVRNNAIEAVIVNLRDITDRKKAEEGLKKSEEKYRLLADHMKDQVWLMDMNMKITYVSPSVEKLTDYSADEIKNMNWFNILTPESVKKATDFISTEMPAALKTISNDRLYKTLELEFILKNGRTVWGECEFSFIRDEFGRAISILGEARNITERRLAEEKLQKTLESLKKAVGTTIQVLVSALEARDPYTAGHQSRTANLACAIAREMGLDEDKIEGLNMAGIIHDIGKLSIPTEILAKPTKLTHIEFSLIKVHPRSGYEMMKDVESPWPLAEIIHQHHERINGTGYPRNLKGNDILLEARIMAVADVVEAIASHRPYRASLGLEVAIHEIEKNKDILYDKRVVDACVKLFREKNYELN